MNKNLIIMAIIAVGSAAVGLSYGVTNGQIIVGDLTVTGTCSGCGAGEGSFTTWTSIFNNTVAGTGALPATNLRVATNGTVLVLNGANVATIVNKAGTIIAQSTGLDNLGGIKGYQNVAQSITGKYKVIIDNPNNAINIYKNDALIKHTSYTNAQFVIGGADTPAIAISSDGKYIAFYAEDSGGILGRIVILEGS